MSVDLERHIESFYHLGSDDGGVRYCRGTACFVARHLNRDRWDQACAQDKRVYCLGECYAAPAFSDDFSRPQIEIHSRHPVVLSRIVDGGAQHLDDYIRYGGYAALGRALEMSPESIIGQVELSGLRGRGGAAFPTGTKWRAVSIQPRREKFAIANADEGDPGAYIDRFIMEDDPFCLIEGLTIAAYAIGADKGFIYLRTEYPKAQASLQSALIEARAAHLLGQHIRGSTFSFDVELHVGRGSYVCGEETALINSIAGKRPEPDVRPPYPTQQGLFGKPTLVNNVETLANIPWIVTNGGDAYRGLGVVNSPGTKVVSLNSLFRRPGLYEVEFGVPVRRIVEELGGGLKTGELKGLMIGGPLAGILPPSLLDTPFTFQNLRSVGATVGHGGIVAFDEQTDVAELIRHVFEFGAFESCGKCTPCRIGSRRAERIFSQVVRGAGVSLERRAEFEDVVQALALTSLCGLGSGLAEFAESVLKYYPEELALCFRQS